MGASTSAIVIVAPAFVWYRVGGVGRGRPGIDGHDATTTTTGDFIRWTVTATANRNASTLWRRVNDVKVGTHPVIIPTASHTHATVTRWDGISTRRMLGANGSGRGYELFTC
jgi:hypothetical protein